MRIAILAKGKTLGDFKGREGYDEVWGLNQIAQTHDLDRLFVMDDLELRLPFYNGPEFPEWLKTYPKPIITSKQYDAWPTSEAFPLLDVAKFFGIPLGIAFYSTVDYMMALSIFRGAKRLDLYGVDCMSPNMELERTSTAVWIGAAMSRGIRVTNRKGSFSRRWTDVGKCFEQGFYGYVERPRIEDLVASNKAA